MIIREAGGSIATHELFERCGFTVDTVDEFYEHLKIQLNQGLIRLECCSKGPQTTRQAYYHLYRARSLAMRLISLRNC